MALKSMTVENFRALDLRNEELGKITVLCGANSVGKSSFLKSILMMKQIDSEGDLQQGIIPLKGSLVDLGSYKSLVRDHRWEKDITVGFSADLEPGTLKSQKIDLFGDEVRYSITFAVSSGDSLERPFLKRYCVEVLSESSQAAKLEVTRNSESDNERRPYFVKGEYTRLREPDLANWRDAAEVIRVAEDYVREEDREKFENLRSNFENFGSWADSWHNWCTENHEKLEDYRSLLQKLIRMPGINLLSRDADVTCENASFRRQPFSKGLCLQEDAFSIGEKNELTMEFIKVLQENASIRSIMNRIDYLGPIRERPQRIALYDDSAEQSIGNAGENAPYIMAKRGGKIISKPWRLENAGETPAFFAKRNENSTLEREIDDWMEHLGCDRLHCRQDPKCPAAVIVESEIAGSSDGVSLADVGYGVGQIFPIIVEGLRMNEGDTLFVEQPEVHLHPKMQGDLADFFIAQALAGKQFIVETHSDHIVNRLVRRVVEDGLEGDAVGLKDLIQLAFLERNNENQTILSKVQIDSNLGIVNWPKGFFDQNADESREIMRTTAKKIRKVRAQNV